MSSAAVLVSTEAKTLPLVTERQRQVLFHASMGLGYKQIAFKMGISEGMVKYHAFDSFRRLREQGFEAENIVSAVAVALRHGLIA
jgi:DNA-binding NarL/FixJ family response regulator